VEREEGHAVVGEGSKVRSVSDCRLGVRSKKKDDEW
jgi:hypothetical protein